MIVEIKSPKYLWRELRTEMIVMFVVSSATFYLDKYVYNFQLAFPDAALGIFGLAITFFVIFRSNKVYDRWWEARIIWGQVVNDSRTWVMKVLVHINAKNASEGWNEASIEELKKRLVYRHLAFINSLRLGLRRQEQGPTLARYLAKEELETVLQKANTTTHLNKEQAREVEAFFKSGVEQGRYKLEMLDLLRGLYDDQGKCERIKNTPFPMHYTWLTDIAVWGYAIVICIYIVEQFEINMKADLNWITIPLATVIGSMIVGLERLAKFHEDPFNLQVHDTPMETLCRSIEIDLREMLDEKTELKPLQPKEGVLF